MINLKNKADCYGCTSCMAVCPKNAITMIEDEEGFKYPRIDEDKCINCGLCEKVCPKINEYRNKELLKEAKSYGGFSNSELYRERGTSGGIFSNLAEFVINNNGYVCGAIYDDSLNVIHTIVDNLNDLKKLCGSKYVQSDMKDNFKNIKKLLDNNNLVLFSGTPCQVSGLNSYLRKEYDNLYTIDVVCHGSPSPKVYRKYLDYLKNNNNSDVCSIAFRTKITGWKRYSTCVKYKNNKEEIMFASENPYMRGFLKDIYLRPSCSDCKSSKLPRYSDITLGDYWGVASKYPHLDDDKGTSFILVNSVKGEKLFSKIKDNINVEQIDLNHAIKGNPSMVSSVKENKKRKDFFNDLDKLPFDKLSKKYFPKTSIYKKVCYKIRSIGGKIKRKIIKK